MSSSWPASWPGAVAACVLAGLGLWPTVLELVASWQKSEAYRYAWLVVPTFVYLLGWHHRGTILTCQPRADLLGVVAAGVAAIGWSVGAAANIEIGRQLALILVIQAIVLSVMGRQLYGRLLPLMGLLFLSLPSADLLQEPLRGLTVNAIELFARLADLPCRIDGFSVRVGEQAYFVLDACAGLSHVTLTFFLGYCCGLLMFRSLFSVLSFALLGGLLGVLSNLLRVNAIIWLDRVQGSQMDLAAHVRIQWLVLLLVLTLFFYILTRLKAEVAGEPSPIPPLVPVSRMAWQIPVAAGLVVLMITTAAGRLLKDEGASPPAPSLALGPAEYAGIAGIVGMAGWTPASPLAWSADGPLLRLSAGYRRTGQELLVRVFETHSPGVKLPESLLAPQAQDQRTWRDAPQHKLGACLASICRSFIHVEWTTDEPAVVRHVYFNYSLGDFHTPSKLVLRLAAAWSRLTGNRNNPRLIGFSVEGEGLRPAELLVLEQAVEAALAPPSD